MPIETWRILSSVTRSLGFATAKDADGKSEPQIFSQNLIVGFDGDLPWQKSKNHHSPPKKLFRTPI